MEKKKNLNVGKLRMFKYILFVLLLITYIIPRWGEPLLNDDMLNFVYIISGSITQIILALIIAIATSFNKQFRIILVSSVLVVNLLFLFNYISSILEDSVVVEEYNSAR